MKIHLSNSAFIHNINSFLRGFDPDNPNILEVTANNKWVFVHPLVVSMVAALGLKVGKGNVSFQKSEARSMGYFERIGLFNMLGVESGIIVEQHEESGRFIPVTQIRTAAEQSKLISDIIPLLHLEKEYQVQTIVYVLGELVRNVIEHSDSEHGAIVCAQFYKDSNCIRIGITDTGIGIKASLSNSWPTPDHLEAIRLSLIPGITGTTAKVGGTEQNAGAGLFFIKSIAKTNRDYFMIYSGDSMYKLHRAPQRVRLKLNADPFDDKHAVLNDLPFFNGTVVGIDITLDQTQEFDTLMKLFKDVWSKTVSERKRDKYKTPKFS